MEIHEEKSSKFNFKSNLNLFESMYYSTIITPLVSGALAGLTVDITLFPIDTIKTRLQSSQGFWQSGGFKKIYSGIGSTGLGSAPGSALFFLTYESMKNVLKNHTDIKSDAVCYMASASVGETMACLVRVPVEVVKQRAQAFQSSSMMVFRETLARSGVRGLYRGYSSTIMREIPFSMIQFPLWETAKTVWARRQQRSTVEPYQSMICGSLAGGISAFLTTPLDVAKTQIMLQNFPHTAMNSEEVLRYSRKLNIMPVRYFQTLKNIYNLNGLSGLWAGAIPRVMWISLGGAIFLGGYEKISIIMSY